MKYIIFKESYTKFELPILFPEIFAHNVMAKRFENFSPVSAGFYSVCDYVNEGHPYTHGESVTLKLKSRPQDLDIINRVITER